MFSGLGFDLFSAADWGGALNTFSSSTQGVLSAFQPVLQMGIATATSIAQAKQAIKEIKSSPIPAQQYPATYPVGSGDTYAYQQPSNNIFMFSMIAVAAAVGLLFLANRGGRR